MRAVRKNMRWGLWRRSVAGEDIEGGGDDGPRRPVDAPDKDEIAAERRGEPAQIDASGRGGVARGDLRDD
jgi:hypothetical protein